MTESSNFNLNISAHSYCSAGFGMAVSAVYSSLKSCK